MDITFAQYVSEERSVIRATIDGEEMFVPTNSDNRHYQAIQEWVAEGNTIQEAE